MNFTKTFEIMNGTRLPESVLRTLAESRQHTGVFYHYYRKNDMVIRERLLPALDGSRPSTFYDLDGTLIGGR